MADIERGELRVSRYSQLRVQGFSPTEARRLRDWKGTRITGEVERVERSIARVPVAQRTEAQSERLGSIRRFRRETRTREFQPIESRMDRKDNFARWTSDRRFPLAIQRQVLGASIAEINRAAGFNPNNSYGFRLFYHRYVNGASEIEAIQQVERRDT